MSNRRHRGVVYKKERLLEWLSDNTTMTVFGILFALASIVIPLAASAHALLFRRDKRTTIAWIGLIWLTPFLGALLYVLLGVNRLRRRGGKIKIAVEQEKLQFQRADPTPGATESPPSPFAGYKPLMHLVERVTRLPLLAGNEIVPLCNGDNAYPEMLDAINNASTSIAMASYIFAGDRSGREFLAALEAAMRRGVQVRVLVDDVGARYSRPTFLSLLERHGVPHAAFLPTRTPLSISYANLRNHRKILVVDGKIGFTGGMNVLDRCRLDWKPKDPIVDISFRMKGPVVAHLQETFSADWAFTTGEQLHGETWFPQIDTAGETWARGVPDGPDEDLGNLPLTMHGAISLAKKRIDIVTPYFLPDATIAESLVVAAMRGVQVRVIVPQNVNIRLVQWASSSVLDYILARCCKVFATPLPFDHSKIMLVDDAWSLVGSSNWDPRSLRLNFEFNVECYDRGLCDKLTQLIDEKVKSSKELTVDTFAERSLPVLLRDQLASLLTPYL